MLHIRICISFKRRDRFVQMLILFVIYTKNTVTGRTHSHFKNVEALPRTIPP